MLGILALKMQPTEMMVNYIDSNLPHFSYWNLSALFQNVFHFSCKEKLLVGTGVKNLSTAVVFS